ncbi:hypothetical protein N656DRAFT_795138 [Canariomyces notabilis]|uniref:Protein kinase domain-containing protein n=1 Tax=Canariomyces notabilis TaxID=2074819 RepID=A0AAN6TMP0_9PEZI|nr:hypothetical protein N656DRAFT_795138 [Canariomyces arenarius]
MASLVVGTSGRQYVRGKVLHHDERNRPTVFKAMCGDEPVVFKHVSESIYSHSRLLATELAGASRLRMPIDTTTTNESSFNSYFTDTLLSLVRADPDVPANELKKILRYAGEGIQEFHVKGWLHNDTSRITSSSTGHTPQITTRRSLSATLGDFDISFKPERETPLRTKHPLGNFMWRSPEGQTGSGVTKASDVFSFGLVCIYALGGADLLLLEDDQELAELAANGISPEQAILTRHFSYFGPATTGLFQQVDSHWHDVLKGVSADAVRALRDFPDQRFEVWGKALGPMALDMISGMTNPDPTARPTINEVLEHPWWEEP